MAIALLTTSGLGTFVDPGTPLVQISNQWGVWQDAPYIQPQTATLTAAPSIGQAEFIWRYGLIQYEDQSAPQWQTPYALAGYFIRIQLYVQGTSTVLWCGVIQDQEYHAFGSSSGNPAGDQIIKAYTLDWCLDRIAIIGAWTTDGYINSCPQFNLRRDWIPHPVGNKATALDATSDDAIAWGSGLPQFGPDKQVWTAFDVITYLLAHYAAPAGLNISIGGQPNALTSWHYVWPLEGLTLRQALDKLIDRRRGLGWWLYSDGTIIEIRIYTTFVTDINIPGYTVPDIKVGDATIPGQSYPPITLPGNANQITYAWDDAILVSDPIIATTESNRYDSIQVQGARMMSTFTVGTADGTLTPMWTPADEALYKGIVQPTSSGSGYTYTADMVRAQDRWKHIYQLFGLNPSWSWMIGMYAVAPGFDNNAYILGAGVSGDTYNDISRPLQRMTRLPRPYTALGPFAGNIQYAEPQIFATPAIYADTMPANTTLPSGQSVIRGDLAGYVAPNLPAFSVTMADIAPAIEINAGLPHIMAYADYTPGTDGDSPILPQYDWRTIQATLCVETDVRPTVNVDLGQNSPWLRTLQIEVPHAEFWWIVPGTITYQNPDLSLNIAGGFASRDDTQILRNVAALAAAWYGVIRTPVSWKEKSYLTALKPGTMITATSASVGGWVPVNTAISAVTWDFLNISTQVQTGFGELDASIVLDIPGMSDFASVGRAFNRLTADVQQQKQKTANLPSRTPPAIAGGGSIARFSIAAIYGDYLACNPISVVSGVDTIDTSTVINIAKPWLLRKSAWNNPVTIVGSTSVNSAYVRNNVVCNYVSDTERTAYQVSTLPTAISTSTPAVTEDQILNPIYKIADIVYAITCQNIGIIKDDSGNNLSLTYLDVNVDARAWSVNPGTQGNGGIQP